MLKKILMLIFVLALMIGCTPQVQDNTDDGVVNGDENVPSDMPPDEDTSDAEVQQINEGVEDVSNSEDELNLSELDEIEQDLNDFNW